jgi:cholera toxin transcriptional activator
MTDSRPARRYRFGIFEADAISGELRRQGIRVKLNAQPFQLLLLLLDNPGQVLTRDEIRRQLWPDGTFVDFDHGVNSAINRIREALGDSAGNPLFVQTLARRGYRFVAPVETLDSLAAAPPASVPDAPMFAPPPEPPSPDPSPYYSAPPVEPDRRAPSPEEAASRLLFPPGPAEYRPMRGGGFLAAPQDLPRVAPPIVAVLFLLLQAMYLAFYIGALANLPEIEDLFAVLPWPAFTLDFLTVSAAILIPVRAFVSCAVLFRPPGFRERYVRLWPGILLFDVLWALAPFLLLHHINFGLAIACTALLVYSPFAQRSLVLMGAGLADTPPAPTARYTRQ